MAENGAEELLVLSERCLAEEKDFEEVALVAKSVVKVAQEVGAAWSGSSLGYHSRVYFAEMRPPPPGINFSVETGLGGAYWETPDSRWTEFRFSDVQDYIYKKAGSPQLDELRTKSAELNCLFDNLKPEVESILTVAASINPDAFLISIVKKVEELRVISYDDLGRNMIGSGQIMTRDHIAVSQGRMTAPHQSVIADMMSLSTGAHALKTLGELSKQAGLHLARTQRRTTSSGINGAKVFIGHGRSKDWRVLKDFIRDRLTLPYDEFNRVPVAGVTNIARLSQMLTDAAFGFIVLTAEDEQKDGGIHARMNVIHEVGLFQGKLGFTKAIVLLEEGCEEFSNIHGLGQIRYPSGKIEATFEEVRQVLEREGMLED